ncbi:MAG: hypothetical protein KJZ78_04695 [Bryobacteraceae bacterium]|nr:hypothetical protein [Bryobacteraceae bacterium]
MRECENEGRLLAALRNAQPDPALLAHAEHCPVCRDSMLVWRYFEHQAESEGGSVALPAPSSIWRRAQLAEKRAKAKQSMAPIRIMQILAAILVPAALLAPETLGGFGTVSNLSPIIAMAVLGFVLLLLPIGGVLYVWARE